MSINKKEGIELLGIYGLPIVEMLDIQSILTNTDEIVDLDYEVNQLKKYITGKADMKPIHHRYKEGSTCSCRGKETRNSCNRCC